MTESPKFCQEPGCGLETLKIREQTFEGDWVDVYRCPRNADAHALCAQLSESQSLVVALREALKEAGTIHGPLYEDSAETMGKACHCMHCAMIRAHLANSSATAQRIRAEIEREAVEKAGIRVGSVWVNGRKNSLIAIRAAILGEKEKS